MSGCERLSKPHTGIDTSELEEGSANIFFAKGQTAIITGFVAHVVSTVSNQLCRHSTKEATQNRK